METLEGLKALTEAVRENEKKYLEKLEKLEEESALKRPIKEYSDSELSRVASTARERIKAAGGPGKSPISNQRLREAMAELGRRAAIAVKAAIKKPEYRKRMMDG